MLFLIAVHRDFDAAGRSGAAIDGEKIDQAAIGADAALAAREDSGRLAVRAAQPGEIGALALGPGGTDRIGEAAERMRIGGFDRRADLGFGVFGGGRDLLRRLGAGAELGLGESGSGGGQDQEREKEATHDYSGFSSMSARPPVPPAREPREPAQRGRFAPS